MKITLTRKKPGNFERILDENNAPVARMRLFSRGVQFNNRILDYEAVAGDKGCLACGNCIDACPVVKEKKRLVAVQNQRTSMSLENIVGTECRRCYACVRSCPQVGKDVKEEVRSFRRGERIVHNYTAALIFILAATGIFLYHYKKLIPDWHHTAFKTVHIIGGLLILLSPLLFYILDRHHMKRAIENVYRFGNEDVLWLKNFAGFLRNPIHKSLPNWREFNPYHKVWAAYLSVVIPLLGLTGIINIFGPEILGSYAAGVGAYIHVTLALITDLLVITHLYFKLVRWLYRDVSDSARAIRNKGSLNHFVLYHHNRER